MSTPTIPAGNLFMNATLYTGNGSTQSITNGASGQSFQPDLVWCKIRSPNAYDHRLADSVRGVNLSLTSNNTNAEASYSGVTAFNSNGFTLGSSGTGINESGSSFVGWQWKANGAAVSNTAGSITSQVSANTTSGFSVITYTGTGANATVGHGLGVAPSMIIVKKRSASGDDWVCYNSNLGNTQFIRLNTTAAAATFNLWQNTTPTSSVFSISTDTSVNGSTATYVAYCWSQIAGYSAFGSYTGNGSADGPFVYTNFRPRFILIKRTDGGAGSWFMYDTSRNTYNAATTPLQANTSDAELTGRDIDVLSNGFKCRSTDGNINTSSGTYVYAAFAENPFKYSNAR
jgi:hypothetical protein